ncbi:MAG: alpha amylase C-terminal domain-containing protein [Candidatus Competibacteraceae bacterium]|nr:alpha amylase C-terminal domain-containing protein [Candidatus Competibacteraceae bacterium]
MMKLRDSNTVRSGLALAVAALAILTVSFPVSASNPNTFVHLFEWSWNDIAHECEAFLGPKGYDAVQISPPNEHIQGSPWWTRYQPVSYQLVSRSGDAAAFRDMVQRCHAAGVKIYADAVINHTADQVPGPGVGGTVYSRKHHPTIPFAAADYHDDCDINPADYYSDAGRVFGCEVSNLPDLNTGQGNVQDRIAGYLRTLVEDEHVDGLRIDAAKHIAPDDLRTILNKADNPFAFLEVIGVQGQVVQPNQYTAIANVTDFKYGTDIAGKFRGDFNGSLSQLRTFGDSWGLVPSDRAVVFVVNHDRERGHGGGGNLTYKDGARYNLANVFMLAHPQGYPKVMSGYRFDDGNAGPPSGGGCANNAWVCEHRWGNIANMVAYRKFTVGACRDGTEVNVDHWWSNGQNQIAFGCGDKGFVVINNEGGSLDQRLRTGLAAGRYCNILSNDDPCGGEIIEVDAQGFASFHLAGMKAAALYGGARPGGDSAAFAKNFSSLFFRGTPNNWSTTPMHLVADHTWEARVTFDGQAEQRFKIDVAGDWSHNYGDNNANGILDRTGRDIFTGVVGAYRVQVNDQTLRYTLSREEAGASAPESDPDRVAVDTLGAIYTPARTTFSLWSPDHGDVQLWLDGQTHAMRKVPDFNGYTDVYQVTVDGDHRLKPYHFLVNGIAVRDPYGRMVEPNTHNNIVMDLTKTQLPGGWAPRPPLAEREDAILYELHVRDFTIDPSSGVPAGKRGKFLGLIEPGTTHNGHKTGLDHLIELGITHVQLMPVYDFASCPNVADQACYNWGYDPRNFNVPEERYSLTPFDYENRVVEFKKMVDELHQAGLRVIIDVVYNHTFQKEMFEPITGRYYTATDLSGTGNSLDANVPMVGRMIRDSLEYWVREYNVDGFRFDLIGVFDYDEVGDWGRYLNTTFPDRTLLIYGEPWNGFAADPREPERVRLGTIAHIHDAHVGVFNPKFREAIKGVNDSGGCNSGDCYAFNANPDVWRIVVGSRGGIRFANDPFAPIDTWDPMFAADPEQSINYVSAHDNLTLRDKILLWADRNGRDRGDPYLRRIQQFANGLVLTSQGIPFLHAGVEMLRDKQGDHNSYQSGDAVNQIRWEWKTNNADIFAYYKDAIALRKAHSGFRMNTWREIDQHVTTTTPRHGVVVNHIQAGRNGDDWSEIIVIANSADNYTFTLPPGAWKVAMEKSDPSAGNGRPVSGTVVAEGTAVTVVYKD